MTLLLSTFIVQRKMFDYISVIGWMMYSAVSAKFVFFLHKPVDFVLCKSCLALCEREIVKIPAQQRERLMPVIGDFFFQKLQHCLCFL